MNTYSIEVTKKTIYEITVKARNKDDAIDKASDLIETNPNDYFSDCDAEYEVYNETKGCYE